MGFSPLLPLTREALREHVPPDPGVYELRSPKALLGAYTIIYLGSVRDLYKRLTAHLRGYSGNARLREYAGAGGTMLFRYRPVAQGWREMERARCIAPSARPLACRHFATA